MLYKSSLTFLSVTSFLVPITFLNAQENSNKSCSMLTEVGDSGEVIWAINDDLSQLLAEAKELGISAADYQKLCAGEDVVQEASAEEDTEESLESVEELAEAETTGVGAKGALALLPLAALGGGGGGGGGSTYSSTTEGSFGTEYNNQAGLASVNALGLNDYGYTGNGIKVGVVDSGIAKTHAEFDGRTIYGQDFASSGTGYGYDENGHGSHVASIIAGERDGSGMRGVAYDATLFPAFDAPSVYLV